MRAGAATLVPRANVHESASLIKPLPQTQQYLLDPLSAGSSMFIPAVCRILAAVAVAAAEASTKAGQPLSAGCVSETYSYREQSGIFPGELLLRV